MQMLPPQHGRNKLILPKTLLLVQTYNPWHMLFVDYLLFLRGYSQQTAIIFNLCTTVSRRAHTCYTR